MIPTYKIILIMYLINKQSNKSDKLVKAKIIKITTSINLFISIFIIFNSSKLCQTFFNQQKYIFSKYLFGIFFSFSKKISLSKLITSKFLTNFLIAFLYFYINKIIALSNFIIDILQMPNNFIQKKSSQNCKLLTLLTNRQKSKSLPNLKNDWPGKINPNFALNLKLNINLQKNGIPQSRRFSSRFKSKFINQIPSVQVPQQGKLQLKPCLSNKKLQKGRFGLSQRNSRTQSTNRRQGVIRIQQNEDTLSMSNIFKNTKISKKVNQIIDKEICLTSRDNRPLKNQQNARINKKLANTLTGEFRQKSKVNEKRQYNREYKIDFLAFGYIEKVIENPQLWGKYVHKISKQSQSNSNNNHIYHNK